MKIFQCIQSNFAIIGITVDQARERTLLSLKHIIIFLAMSASTTTQVLSIMYLAETFEEYTFCMYGIFTVVMTQAEFAIHIWKMKQLFKFIENFEHLISSSELYRDLLINIFIPFYL